MKFTLEDKLRMYAAGEYVFHAPPVCTVQWDMYDWIKFIDAGNGWRPVRAVTSSDTDRPTVVKATSLRREESNHDHCKKRI